MWEIINKKSIDEDRIEKLLSGLKVTCKFIQIFEIILLC